METVYDVLTALDKLGALTDLPLERESGINFDEINRSEGTEVALSNLSYYPKGGTKPILEQLSLTIPAGQKLCIAGYNGSGKTTLIQVISCLLLRCEGSITYNGVPRNNINLDSLRGNIGDFSSQEDVFKGTFFENIALGYAHLNLSDVVEVAKKVGLDEYVRQYPEGYELPLLPGGKNHPRSVVAKIILARSLISNPKLLAIEEFFANIEAKYRDQIADLLTAADSPWTLVAVSDDPVLASRCERIIVMEAGKIVADGSYEAIKRTTHFAKVFKT